MKLKNYSLSALLGERDALPDPELSSKLIPGPAPASELSGSGGGLVGCCLYCGIIRPQKCSTAGLQGSTLASYYAQLHGMSDNHRIKGNLGYFRKVEVLGGRPQPLRDRWPEGETDGPVPHSLAYRLN